MYLTQDSSGNFVRSIDVLPEIKSTDQTTVGNYTYPYYDKVFAFEHSGQNKILITKRLSGNTVSFMIYDPKDFSKPLASNDITLEHAHQAIATLGNSLIFSNAIANWSRKVKAVPQRFI